MTNSHLFCLFHFSLASPTRERERGNAVSVGLWLGNGCDVFKGRFSVNVTAHGGGLDGQNRHARGSGAVDFEGVPGVRSGGGDGGGEGNGHEAEPLPLKILHGRPHILLHQLRHLVLRHRHPLVVVRWWRRLRSVTAPSLHIINLLLMYSANQCKFGIICNINCCLLVTKLHLYF